MTCMKQPGRELACDIFPHMQCVTAADGIGVERDPGLEKLLMYSHYQMGCMNWTAMNAGSSTVHCHLTNLHCLLMQAT